MAGTAGDTEEALALLQAAMAPAEEARALEFAAYHDQGLFALEMDRVFRGDWVAVCAEAALAKPGDYLAISVGGEPLALIRGTDGVLRALSNVCRHRGTLMLEPGADCLEQGTIVCPYHAWSYSDSGAFRGAPYTHGIEVDRDEHSLPSFRTEVWMGVVFVCLSSEAPPLAERLAGITPHLAEFDMESFAVPGPLVAPEVWEANWKLIAENGMESYHLFKVHEKTLEKVTPTRGAYYIEGSAPWTLTGGKIVQGEGGVLGKLLSQLFGGATAGDHYVLVSIPPSFVGVATLDSWDWIIVHPVSPTSSNVYQGTLMRSAPDQVTRAISDGYATAFLEEDRAICERAQAGMAAKLSRGGRLVPLERVVVDFHHYLGWRLTGESPPGKTVERAE
ncbi:MAG: aromatic ring-hydroxylating dioxygenase subunit alpha [Chloroflexota bacterium]|nr:aromatic ring-hydroxylating dioxygenase subunit alpha [Chloroflexota bacterium]